MLQASKHVSKLNAFKIPFSNVEGDVTAKTSHTISALCNLVYLLFQKTPTKGMTKGEGMEYRDDSGGLGQGRHRLKSPGSLEIHEVFWD